MTASGIVDAVPAEEPGGDSADREVVLGLESVSKRFPGVLALDDVSLDLRAGEVHVLLGENGAGKSTLIKVVAGVYRHTSGRVFISGREVRHNSPREARSAGVSTVFQELSLVPTLTVEENLFLGRIPAHAGLVSRRAMRRRAGEALRRIGVTLPLKARVGSLPRSAQQLVEIAKALIDDARILIFDEPTASLGDRESDRLLDVIRTLAGSGIGIIYITHRMREVRDLSDRVTVLRDGRLVATLTAAEADEERLVQMMTGRQVDALYPGIPPEPGPVRLAMSNVSGPGLHDVSIEARAGEIVGLAGLLGSGKSTVGRACFGLSAVSAGTITVDGKVLRSPSPVRSLRHGVVYYPPDRRGEGLALCRSMLENLTLGSLRKAGAQRGGFIRRRYERDLTRKSVSRLDIRPGHPGRLMQFFSGGNQQKVLLARGLIREAAVHIFDEPTVGIDVGAKADVYQVLQQLCESGRAVVVISSDLPEVLGLCHRVYVMHEGRIAGELTGDAVTESNVLARFFGPPADPAAAPDTLQERS
ncbi:sugar ABC transporter ATP-binding protein [Planosporangium flavigriseum]|uniref:Sugar ABC transporter ATP-binding protein n=1 Tax=Planosporangium flavigriseum TaxID=373681 RepID=A0A8J3PN34_9ACTN|nr:sugar ABC transporter ATP-binding protein [Planosporangium flavigriseum]NJC65691.1 sugar ABC transporter ATP-binding protein [Planosporangium flavigriseum]GIG73541.1 sugar ABC transporter ATP-binding protein [Planosporangium flavigriseum]